MKKTLLKTTAVIAGLVLLPAAAIYLEDYRFWNRYVLMLNNKGVLPAAGWAGSEYPVKGGEHQLFDVVELADRTVSQDALDAITRYAADRNSSSLLVWHRGKLQLREHFKGTDPNTLLVGKSMAKMVVAIVVGRAVKQGYIAGLDEPAATYIKEWQGTEKDRITLRHLLHMAAGFEKFYTLDMNPFGRFARSYLSGHNEDVLIDGYDLVNKPGTHYDYSQVTSDLIGLILERATGQPYGQYLSEQLIQPIGAQGGLVMMNRPNGLAHTGCCLSLPAESWLRMGILLLRGGVVEGRSLFPDGWMRDHLQPSPANPAFGLHIWLGQPYLPKRSWGEVGEPTGFGVVHSEPYIASDLFLFDGNGHQVVYIVPSEELVIVRTGSWSSNEWDNAFIPNTVLRALAQ